MRGIEKHGFSRANRSHEDDVPAAGNCGATSSDRSVDVSARDSSSGNPANGNTPRVLKAGSSPVAPRKDHGRANVLGCEIDRLDLDQAVAVCETAIETRGQAQHMAVNVAKLMAIRTDQRLRDSVTQCELITADGQPLVWASRLLRDPLPERVAGIDLMNSLLARAATRKYRVYMLGARAEILERAVDRLREQYPDLAIVGHQDGYYEGSEEPAIAAKIAADRPDMLFVAMSSPRKEYFLARYRDQMAVPFVMGVGGSIDVVAGLRSRAPVMLQRLGLEWLFRLVQEPRRLAPRYVTTNVPFVLLLIREFILVRVMGRSRCASSRSSAHGRTS